LTNMRFNVKEARDHLIMCGYVYTLRKWGKYPKICTAIYDKGKDIIRIGRIEVTKVLDNITDYRQLEPYYNGSGFKSPAQWFNRAISVGKVDNFYLYKVEGNGKR